MATNEDGTEIYETPSGTYSTPPLTPDTETGTFGTTGVSPTGTPIVVEADAGAWHAHPIYVVRAVGVGSLVKGTVVQAGDLGSATDIQRLEEIGAIAAWHTDVAKTALADAAATPAPDEVPVAPLEATPLVQQGIPYVDDGKSKKGK